MAGRKFTWVNNLQNQTFEKLDKILVCTDFESKYPVSSVRALSREISNHTPLFYSTNSPSPAYQPQFKFELGWLLRDGFCEMVRDVWHNVLVEGSPPREVASENQKAPPIPQRMGKKCEWCLHERKEDLVKQTR